jgi:hypothetical protein
MPERQNARAQLILIIKTRLQLSLPLNISKFPEYKDTEITNVDFTMHMFKILTFSAIYGMGVAFNFTDRALVFAARENQENKPSIPAVSNCIVSVFIIII